MDSPPTASQRTHVHWRRALAGFGPADGFDLVRVFLGAAFVVRGALLLTHPKWLGAALGSGVVPVGLAWSIGTLHLVGGACLALGLRTRLAAATQLVPMLGALLLAHSGAQLATADQSRELVALVTVLLALFVFFGAGRWSVDGQPPRGRDRAGRTHPPQPINGSGRQRYQARSDRAAALG